MSHKYPVEVLQAALEKGVSEGLLQRPSGELELNKVLSSLDSLLHSAFAVNRELAERKEQERLQPVKVAVDTDIPFAGNDVLFIDAADLPGREVLSRIHRCEFKSEAFCFVGSAPEWVNELVMTGHRVYELPAGTALKDGQRALQPHPSSIGARWFEVKVGETVIQFN